ncbi:MAG: nucleotidyltransferase [Planctomycetes bacterium]|nr:nucleotidyltransferase [Planctomycetota bacterium]
MTRDDFRRQADLVREIPLEVVLTSWGAARDPRDTSRWRTERGPLSVNGTKFFSWQARHGGGGAIDLVMHLGGWDARRAIRWLGRQLGGHLAVANPPADNQSDADPASNSRSTSSPTLHPNSHHFTRSSQGRYTMANEAQRQQMSRLLEHAVQILDIPDALYEEAVAKHEEVGNWLEDHDVLQGRRPPEIYPQGSFRLGTVIRPLTDKDEYDIDLVYLRDIKKGSTNQERLKQEAGDHLKAYVAHTEKANGDAPKLEEGRRCWTLTFNGRFHMDVLPAIPDAEGLPGSILITDCDLREWQHSNPIGYAEWFKLRMRTILLEKRAALAASLRASQEDVPDWKVKTPLQRAVQLLKRHRDLHFQNDHDDRPVSIIITILAAKAYNNQADLYDAVIALVRDMAKYIEYREGVPWVPNPVNPKENFADKWQKHPQREKKCREWLTKVEHDLIGAMSVTGIPKVVEALGRSMGKNTMTKAAELFGRELQLQRVSGGLTIAVGSGMLLAGGNIKVKDHTFFGNVEDA